MIKWITNRILMARDAYNDTQYEKERELKSYSASNYLGNAMKISTRNVDADAMSFKILKCNNGYILEHSTYDTNTDHTDISRHIIRESDDLAKSIADAIVLELLRK